MSDGGITVVLTSTSPASNDCTAVVPSVMIRPFARWSFTSLASRQPFHLARSISASCFQTASLNGPSVTMWPGSVHFSPHFVTAFLFTARNEWWAACWMNHGCGEVSWTFRVYLSGAEMATFALRALQSSFLESYPLYSCAPLIPYNWYAGSAHSSCESVRSQEKTKSCAVSGSPFVHLPSCRRWNVTLAPFTSQLCARLGTGLRVFR